MNTRTLSTILMLVSFALVGVCLALAIDQWETGGYIQRGIVVIGPLIALLAARFSGTLSRQAEVDAMYGEVDVKGPTSVREAVRLHTYDTSGV